MTPSRQAHLAARPGWSCEVWVRRGCGLIVVAVAAYSSYEHQRGFALHGGADATNAALWPLSVDGLLLLATVGLLKPGHQTRRMRVAVWLAGRGTTTDTADESSAWVRVVTRVDESAGAKRGRSLACPRGTFEEHFPWSERKLHPRRSTLSRVRVIIEGGKHLSANLSSPRQRLATLTRFVKSPSFS